MNSISFYIPRTLLAATLLVFATPSSALEQFSFPFDVTVDCPTEQIYIEGTGRFKSQSVEAADNTTYIFHAFWHGRGYGLSTGAEYILNGKWMTVEQENAPFVLRWNDHFQLVGKGNAENFRLYFRLRVVVDPDGRVVVEAENEDWVCPNA